jgi:hypothetical protein
MNTQQKIERELIEIVKEYVACHKNSDINEWAPFSKTGDHKYLAIYDNLSDGKYGEVSSDGGLSQVEISWTESVTGITKVFYWEEPPA